MKNTSIKCTKEDRIFHFFNNLLLGTVLISVLYPLYFIIIASISDPAAVNAGIVNFLPVGITFEGYQKILGYDQIWIGYRNTIFYTTVGTTLNIILTMMLAYPLSRKQFDGRNIIMTFLMITMYFSGGLIPTYLLIKSLGLYNNWLVMVLLGSVSVMNVIITRSFLQSTIPEELFEAATIDGCDHFTYFSQMVLPLSKAIMAVMALYYGVGHWNEFMTGLIYLKDEKLYPLQLILRSILVQNQVSQEMMMNTDEFLKRQNLIELIKYGLIIVSSIPVLLLYPFMQKYFIKGVMIGSVKG